MMRKKKLFQNIPGKHKCTQTLAEAEEVLGGFGLLLVTTTVGEPGPLVKSVFSLRGTPFPLSCNKDFN